MTFECCEYTFGQWRVEIVGDTDLPLQSTEPACDLRPPHWNEPCSRCARLRDNDFFTAGRSIDQP